MEIKPQKYLMVISLVTIIGISFNTKAQSLIKKKDFSPEYTENYIVKNFTGRLVDNTLYFKFLIIENQKDSDYILESSIDGINFSAINQREGHKSPNRIPLLHCYKVDINKTKALYFRIKRIQSQKINYTYTIHINESKTLAFYNEK